MKKSAGFWNKEFKEGKPGFDELAEKNKMNIGLFDILF